MKTTMRIARERRAVVCAAAVLYFLTAAAQRAAGAETATPAVKPAEFKRTGWNAMVRQRFMHPPMLTYTPVEGAVNYRCVVGWRDAKGGAQAARLESVSPEFDLGKVWDSLPTAGPFQVVVEAVDSGGKVLAKTASTCQRIAPFQGPYRPAKCEYGEAGTKTVRWLLKARPGANSYPALFYSSYIFLLTKYVRLNPKGEMAEEAISQAKKYGQEMLKRSTPGDWSYASMPLSHDAKSLQVDRGGQAGSAYLELYAVTHDKAWLDAASRIADTLKKNQLPEGRWPLRVEPRTGKVLSDYTAAQPESFFLLDELIRNHGRKDLREALDKSVAWMLENPCKTYFWTSGFEDCGGAEQRSLTGVDAMYFIEYLLRNAAPGNNYEQIARDLMRYVEDQFVEWEPSGNEITPGVREQYACYVNEDAIVGIYLSACMAFHAKTREEVWLKKARAMADTLTAVQHPDGFYPTFMNHKPSKENPTELKDINYGGIWPNCSAQAGYRLLWLGEYVKAATGN